MEIDVDTSQLMRMGAKYQAVAPLVAQESDRAMLRVVLSIERTGKQLVPVDTGNLRRSLTHEVTRAAGGVVGRVGSNVPYAKIIEDGRTPGSMPPQGVVLGWMSRHGIPADREYLIRRAINRRKQPRPYLKPAIERNRAAINREFGQIPARVMRRLAAR